MAQGVLEFSLDNDPEPMITTCGIDPSAYAGDFQAAVQHFGLSFWDTFQAPWGDEYTLNRAIFYVGQDGVSATIPYEVIIGTAGGSSSTRPPQNVASLVDKITNVAGRRGRGRFYFPGMLSDGGIDGNGDVQSSALTDNNTRLATWFDDLTVPGAGYTASLVPVIFHASGDQTPTPITEFRMDPKVATQRQRLRR